MIRGKKFLPCSICGSGIIKEFDNPLKHGDSGVE